MEESVDSKGGEDMSKKVGNPDDAAELVKKIENMIKSKKNSAVMLAFHEGIIFKKFKENNEFISTITGKFKITKATVNFKIVVVKFIDDYPKMRKSCISLHY